MAAPERAGPPWPDDGIHQAAWLRRLSHALIWPTAKLLWGFKVSGLEHVPDRGPLIMAANHVSNMDGPLILVGADSRRYVLGIGKAELFRVPVLGWYLKKMGAIKLERAGDVGAMRAAIEHIGGGGCLLVFPEGTRSKDGKRGRAKAGVGFLAGSTGAQVVPVHVINTGAISPKGPVEVRFGEPLRYQGDPHDRAACLAFGELVLDRVFKL